MDKELLYRFFCCTTTIEEETAVADWLDADPRNMDFMNSEREKYNSVILHTQEVSGKKRATKRISWVQNTLRYAAIVMLIIAVGGGVGVITRKNTVRQISQQTMAVSVPAGQRVDLTLHDGSSVSLNSGSTIEYPAVFTDNSRRVKLEGEAFFEVEHDASRPFIVETFGYEIEVLGTKFSVNADSERAIFSTMLTEGSVRVVNTSNPEENITLQPDQMVKLTNGQLAVVDDADHDALLWRDGLISLKDIAFDELMGVFEKSYGVNIVIEKATLPEVRSRGKIRVSEGIDHAMRILQRGSEFTYDKDEETNTIYIR